MRIEHYGCIGQYKTCLQFNYQILNEINFFYGLDIVHADEFAVAITKAREKTPSEKAAWAERLRELTEQHLTNQ